MWGEKKWIRINAYQAIPKKGALQVSQLFWTKFHWQLGKMWLFHCWSSKSSSMTIQYSAVAGHRNISWSCCWQQKVNHHYDISYWWQSSPPQQRGGVTTTQSGISHSRLHIWFERQLSMFRTEYLWSAEWFYVPTSPYAVGTELTSLGFGREGNRSEVTTFVAQLEIHMSTNWA